MRVTIIYMEFIKAKDIKELSNPGVVSRQLLNDGDGEFIYVSVTAPPINFGYAYKDKR